MHFMKRIIGFIYSDIGQKMSKYLAASVITTLATFALIYIFYYRLRLSSAGNCSMLASAICILPSYYLNRAWAWGKTGKSHWLKEIIPFWVIAISGLLLAEVLGAGAERLAHSLTDSRKIATVFVMFSNLLGYGLLWVLRFFLLNNLLFIDHSQKKKAELTANK